MANPNAPSDKIDNNAHSARDASALLSDFVTDVRSTSKSQGLVKENRHKPARSNEDSITHLDLSSPYQTADAAHPAKPVDATPSTEASSQHDIKAPFSIGVAEKDQKSWQDISKSNPRLAGKVDNSFTDSPVGYDAAQAYTRNAFSQMVSKYGAEPVEHLLDTLAGAHKNSNPDAPLKRYRNEFYQKPDVTPETLESGSSEKLDDHSRAKLNSRLYNLDAVLATPGSSDKLADIANKLNAGGLKGSLSIDEMTPAVLKSLGKPEEQAAFIQLKNGYLEHSFQYRTFMHANPNHPEYGTFTGTPSETLRAFNLFEAQQPKN